MRSLCTRDGACCACAHRRCAPRLPACTGVLFALEEATSVWSRKLAWRCFLCAATSCFTMAQLHPRMRGGMLSFADLLPLSNYQVRGAGRGGTNQGGTGQHPGLLHFGGPAPLAHRPRLAPPRPRRPSSPPSSQWLVQLPLLVAVSAGGGLLGSLFNRLKRHSRRWRSSRPTLARRLAASAGVALVTVAALTWLPVALGTCLEARRGAGLHVAAACRGCLVCRAPSRACPRSLLASTCPLFPLAAAAA